MCVIHMKNRKIQRNDEIQNIQGYNIFIKNVFSLIENSRIKNLFLVQSKSSDEKQIFHLNIMLSVCLRQQRINHAQQAITTQENEKNKLHTYVCEIYIVDDIKSWFHKFIISLIISIRNWFISAYSDLHYLINVS